MSKQSQKGQATGRVGNVSLEGKGREALRKETEVERLWSKSPLRKGLKKGARVRNKTSRRCSYSTWLSEDTVLHTGGQRPQGQRR